MKSAFIKRHACFIGLSALTLLSLFCIGFLLWYRVASGHGLSVINTNSLYFIGLRLMIYGSILIGWKYREQQIVNINSNTMSQQVGWNHRAISLILRYRIVLYLILFEGLFVQQGWAVLIHGLGGVTDGR